MFHKNKKEDRGWEELLLKLWHKVSTSYWTEAIDLKKENRKNVYELQEVVRYPVYCFPMNQIWWYNEWIDSEVKFFMLKIKSLEVLQIPLINENK
jgi:hypothetical protein